MRNLKKAERIVRMKMRHKENNSRAKLEVLEQQ
jgi:hypothetical protein